MGIPWFIDSIISSSPTIFRSTMRHLCYVCLSSYTIFISFKGFFCQVRHGLVSWKYSPEYSEGLFIILCCRWISISWYLCHLYDPRFSWMTSWFFSCPPYYHWHWCFFMGQLHSRFRFCFGRFWFLTFWYPKLTYKSVLTEKPIIFSFANLADY